MSLNKQEATWNAKQIEDIYLAYKDHLYRFLYRYTADSQLSIDLVQDTFIKFQKYAARFDVGKASIKTYLYQMAYQLMINKLNRRKRFQTYLPFLFSQQNRDPVSVEDRLTIQLAIRQLPDKQRSVILLAYYHDMEQKEIAEILQIPVGTVKSRLHTAIAKLKELMEVHDDEG